MQKKYKCWNYLLIHLRLTSGLTIRAICRQTAIPEKVYDNMESGNHPVTTEDAELLGALFNIDPYYLTQHSLQLQLLLHTEYRLAAKQKQITQLTKALKRKIAKQRSKRCTTSPNS